MLTAARSLVFWLLLPFVAVQALRLRRSAPRLQAAAGDTRGRAGTGKALRLLAIGDSIIAGVGAATLDRALVGRTAESLAILRGRTVEWEAHGISGANARQILADLVPVLGPLPADAMIVSVGVNDVTSPSTIRAWKRHLLALVTALRAHSPNAVIVVAGIPPLRVFPLIPEPLRSLIGFRGETLDRVMRDLLQEHAGVLHTPVVFDIRSGSFCADGFHPSEQSYIEFGEAMAARIATQLSE
jgi:lysophospholipase L1-like esterase